MPGPTTNARRWLRFHLMFAASAAFVVGCSRSDSNGVQTPPGEATTEQPQKTAPRNEPIIDEETFRQAAFEARTETLQQAIEQETDVDAADGEGRTALLLAAFNGHADAVRLLLDNGADVNHRDASGRTALMYAASGPNAETVRVLLEAEADTDVVDKGEGFTALMFAAAEGQTDVVRALLEHDADTEILDVDGDLARDFAAENGHEDIVAMLDAKASSRN